MKGGERNHQRAILPAGKIGEYEAGRPADLRYRMMAYEPDAAAPFLRRSNSEAGMTSSVNPQSKQTTTSLHTYKGERFTLLTSGKLADSSPVSF